MIPQSPHDATGPAQKKRCLTSDGANTPSITNESRVVPPVSSPCTNNNCNANDSATQSPIFFALPKPPNADCSSAMGNNTNPSASPLAISAPTIANPGISNSAISSNAIQRHASEHGQSLSQHSPVFALPSTFKAPESPSHSHSPLFPRETGKKESLQCWIEERRAKYAQHLGTMLDTAKKLQGKLIGTGWSGEVISRIQSSKTEWRSSTSS